MAISFTKIFKKSDSNTEGKKLVEQPTSVEAKVEKEGSTEQEKTTKNTESQGSAVVLVHNSKGVFQ